MSTRSFSRQQAAVIQSRARTLIVRAYAGTGKTTTLVAYAEARPDCNILFVAFNQPIAEDAATRFPSNVTCRTVNSIAYEVFGSAYRSKLGNNRPNAVCTLLGVSVERATDLIKAVDAFCASADPELTARHLPAHCRHSKTGDEALVSALELWACMQDTKDTRIRMSHDGYLKLYQLSKPRLDAVFDIILFDEFQDANPVIIAIFADQVCRKVFVGDPHQSVYAFRGAVNALELIQADETLMLTESYRFGAESAHMATTLLAGFKGETVPLVGLRKLATHAAGQAAGANIGSFDESKPYAILCRTNAGLFSKAVDQLDHKRFHLVGGPDTYVFGKVLDVWNLMSGNLKAIRDPFIRSMRDFEAFQVYAKRANDVEIRMLCGIASDYESMIPDLVSRITAEATKDIADAEVVMTTAHRSKGLEFDQVILGEDFKNLVDGRGSMMDASLNPDVAQEVNLLYVALTRAKSALIGNAVLGDALKAVSRSKLPVPRPGDNDSRSARGIQGSSAADDVLGALGRETQHSGPGSSDTEGQNAFIESKASVLAHKTPVGSPVPGAPKAKPDLGTRPQTLLKPRSDPLKSKILASAAALASVFKTDSTNA